MSFESALLIVACILALGVLASKVASKLNLPVLLLFLVIGMVAGSDGPGGIWFSDARLAQQFGVVALIFILFSGGMDLEWSAAKRHLAPAVSLSTLGVIVTAGITAAASVMLLGFRWVEGFLLGAIVASTDAAAVFSTLSQGKLHVRPDLRRVLELESGSNDPTAIFLTLAAIAAIMQPATLNATLIASFIGQMLLGALGGWALGRGGVLVMRKLRLDHQGLFHAVSLVIVLLSYSGVALAGGNGFLAVYVAGIAFGQGEFRQKKGLRRFHEGIAWLMQITMFVVLGLLVFPSQLPGVLVPGLILTAVLMLVARPLAVAVSLAPFKMPAREQVFVSWAGLRGAVPIVLATYPMLAGVERAQTIFNLVFFVVLFSALLQGPTLALLAERLGLMETPETPDPSPAHG